MRVFIEAAAGSRVRGLYDEATFERKASRPVLLPYPWPYGFVPGTAGISGDGECRDCYVITSRPLTEGSLVECEAFGLLEMFEDGEADHKLLAAFPGEPPPPADLLLERLRSFITGIFAAWPEMRVEIKGIIPPPR